MKFLLLTNNNVDDVSQQTINVNTNLKKKRHKSKIILINKNKKNKIIFKKIIKKF